MTPREKLLAIQRHSGLSQEALASKLGVAFPTLNAWFNERRFPRRGALEAIDSLYAELIGGSALAPHDLEALVKSAQSTKLTPQLLINDQRLVDTLTLNLTYHTDAIEGSTMTIADTRVVLFEGKALANRTLVEQLEAKNHQAALWWLLDELCSPGFKIDETLVLQLHAKLMNGIISDAGRFRRHAARIAGTRVTVSNHLRIPDLIARLLAERPSGRKEIVAFLAVHHAQFEKIHPFSDGNGRVGRLLLLAYALQGKIVPPVIERERRQFYYKALEQAQLNEAPELLQQLLAESILNADADLRID